MNTYSITERNGCRLVTGSVPLSAFGLLTYGMPKGAVIDSHAARLLGVNFAVGLPEDLAELVRDPTVQAAARHRADQQRATGMSDEAREWLATGEHGTSSLTIFQRLTGRRITDIEGHPHDSADLRRCRLLLEAVPDLQARMGEMAAVSPAWKSLVAKWCQLCALMDQEAPSWRQREGTAPRTWELMREAIRGAEEDKRAA